jgi:hypothetical protein
MNHLILRLSPVTTFLLGQEIILTTLFSTLGLRSSHNKRDKITYLPIFSIIAIVFIFILNVSETETEIQTSSIDLAQQIMFSFYPKTETVSTSRNVVSNKH